MSRCDIRHDDGGRHERYLAGLSSSVSRACDAFFERRGEKPLSWSEQMAAGVEESRSVTRRRARGDAAEAAVERLAAEIEAGWENATGWERPNQKENYRRKGE